MLIFRYFLRTGLLHVSETLDPSGSSASHMRIYVAGVDVEVEGGDGQRWRWSVSCGGWAGPIARIVLSLNLARTVPSEKAVNTPGIQGQ